MKLIVANAVGLRPKDLAHAPRLQALAGRGRTGPLSTIFPALTGSVQATWLTGTLPREHGIVANGWYFRDLAQVWLWRQSNHLVQGEKLYETLRRRDESFRCAKMFWWWNMYADVAYSVTPRPEYHADGLKVPGLYSEPSSLAGELQREIGEFPFFTFWGPAAGIESTRWIARAAERVGTRLDPDLMLVYLPHLDYDHQRFGPDDPRSVAAVRALDDEVARLIDLADERGATLLVLSEYGLERAEAPIFVNRLLHERGWLRVQETSVGQLLDAGASRAFAVADHQVAHVYVERASDLPEVAAALGDLDGVAHVLDRTAQREWGIDHERSGELVLVAEPHHWFAYHYWLDEAKRPDFATTVDIHRKPGYDPTELFVDPGLRRPKLRVVRRILQKKLGFRYLMDVIGTDPSIVGGTHGRLFEDPDAGAVWICSDPDFIEGDLSALDVRARILGRF